LFLWGFLSSCGGVVGFWFGVAGGFFFLLLVCFVVGLGGSWLFWCFCSSSFADGFCFFSRFGRAFLSPRAQERRSFVSNLSFCSSGRSCLFPARRIFVSIFAPTFSSDIGFPFPFSQQWMILFLFFPLLSEVLFSIFAGISSPFLFFIF